MKIQYIEVGVVRIPLKTPFKTALRTVTTAEDIVVKVQTDDGAVGYGNAPATVVITGDSLGSIADAVQHFIAPKIMGMDIEDREGICQRIDQSMVQNTSAKAAVDIAVHDLFGQRYGLPLYRLFGGSRSRIQSDLTISVNDPAVMVADAQKALAAGYGDLKLKVGLDAQIDLERVSAIRKAVGPAVRIRLDANQGWQAKEAVRTIRQMEDCGLGIELIEQPVKASDFDGLKFVTDHVATPIMADEAAFSLHDVFRLLSMRACDLINIKLMKAGGLHNAWKIAAMAAAAGVDCMMGCMLESKIGICAAASLSAGCSSIVKNDLDAADLLAADPVIGGVHYEKNELVLPEQPGLGIDFVEGWEPFL
jgi:o-succinylbenzoate synthase